MTQCFMHSRQLMQSYYLMRGRPLPSFEGLAASTASIVDSSLAQVSDPTFSLSEKTVKKMAWFASKEAGFLVTESVRSAFG